MKVDSLFISDTHLGVKHNNAHLFYNVLCSYEFDNLFLLGDIIDFSALQKKIRWKKIYGKIIQKILEISQTKNVVWITGNHEEFIRQFIPFQLGNIRVVSEYIHNDTLLIHGDKFDTLIYKKKWLYGIGGLLYDIIILIDYMFGFNGTLSKKAKKKVKAASTYLNDFYATAIKYTELRECNRVICGHLHNQEIILGKISVGTHYYNCGNFREDADYIIEINGEFKLCSI